MLHDGKQQMLCVALLALHQSRLEYAQTQHRGGVGVEGNVLMVCKKGDSSALIRKYVNEVQLKYGDEYI